MWNRYWHGFGVHRLRLAALRFALFGLLAYDLCVNFITHAPRYGAGGINASQIAWLDAILPMPSAPIVSAAWLLAAFLAARAALGIAVKTSVVAVAVIYSGVYVWCQADSYQHHYFVCLLLVVLAMVPTQAWLSRAPAAPQVEGPPGDVESTDGDATDWSLRMIYVTLALMYLWTGITKANPVWLSGDTLYQLTSSAENRAMFASIGDALGISGTEIYPVMAWAIMLGELTAGLFFIWRRLWIIGLLVVPWFHVGVEVIGFEIELFSWYMLAVDIVLLMPRRVYVAADVGLRQLRAKMGQWRGPAFDAVGARVGVGVVAAALAGAGAAWVPYTGVVGLVVAVVIFSLAAFVRPGGYPLWRVVGHATAGAVLATSAMATDAPFDYYRLWGGDLKKRAIGTPTLLPEAIATYRAANRVTDGPARHFALGKLLLKQGDTEAALTTFADGIARHETALAAEKTASFRDPTNGELQYDLAERLAGLASKRGDFERALRRAGRTDEAAAQADKATGDVGSGRDALTKAVGLLRSGRYGRIKRILDRSAP
ncbi:MAG: hypothetical protein ACI9U2_004561 [Bradymonadia bacterium]|jgi:hypothetical protein